MVSRFQELNPLLLYIIPSRVEKIRPQICCIIISRRRITNIRNLVLDIEEICSSYMARQLQLVLIRIDLLNYLNKINLFYRKLVVIAHRKMIFSQNGPNKVTYLKLHIATSLIRT